MASSRLAQPGRHLFKIMQSIKLVLRRLRPVLPNDLLQFVWFWGLVFAGLGFFLSADGFAQTPVITSQPVSQDVSAGVSIALHVAATGKAPFVYQWSKNGRVLSGATHQMLVFKSLSPTNSGSYRVTVRNSLGAAESQIARIEVNNLSPVSLPIPVRGWNQDVVLENSTVPLATADFDTLGNYWFEAGWGGHADGLPVSERFTSSSRTNVLFRFQPYIGNNVLRLDNSAPAGTLALLVPAPYRSLAILAASGGRGGNTGRLVLNFSDGTSVTNVVFIDRDWHTVDSSSAAFSGLGRYRSTDAPFGYENQVTGFGMWETDLDLVALHVERKFLASVWFTKPTDSQVTGIFAISGEANKVPHVNLERLLDGRVGITISGFPDTSYEIDASNDLIQWTPLVALANTNGVSQFFDSAALSRPSRFYRILTP